MITDDPLLMIHVLALFVLVMLVTPSPIGSLLFAPETVVIDICLVTLVQPAMICRVLALIPVVIILAVRVVDAPFPFLPLVPVVIVLWRRHGKGTQWRQQCS